MINARSNASVRIRIRDSNIIKYWFTDSLRLGFARTDASQQLSDTESLSSHAQDGSSRVKVGVRVLRAIRTLILVVAKTLILVR